MVATVVTKAELICSSMVVAPVSVIFGADRVLLLVDVILDFRLFGGSGHRFDQAGAEILGQHDGCIVSAGLHAVDGLFLIVYEAPAEFVVLLEFLDDLPARIEMADQISLVVPWSSLATATCRLPVAE